MLNPQAKHIRAIASATAWLGYGAAAFVLGISSLYLNPFWHFDDGGFLDWRLYWWNAGGEILLAAGMLIEGLALIWLISALIARASKGSWLPYAAGGGLVLGLVAWAGAWGFAGNMNVHFEWNAADGFSLFQVQPAEGQGSVSAGQMKANGQNAIWQSIVQLQIQPELQGYFRMNDWQKMNGDLEIEVARIVPIAWPVALGRGGETLEDPDETPLMRAAEKQDLNTLKQQLASLSPAQVNALDQSGQTALILACRDSKANLEIAKALLAAGADPNLRARNGYAPLTWALARNNAELARLLKRAGARP